MPVGIVETSSSLRLTRTFIAVVLVSVAACSHPAPATKAALQQLGFGWWDGREPKLDISAARPALMDTLADPNPKVRWSAEFDIAAIGPRADKAVPELIARLSNSDEGTRGNACIALGHIGMAASDALPALRERLVDPNPWVRKVARFASARIQGKHPSLVVD